LINKYPVSLFACSKNIQIFCTVTLCIFTLLSCLACTPRSIYLNKNFNPPVYFGQHAVQSGDTLYAIAWRYGRELRELAQANNIHPPYVIRVGQNINLERSKEYQKNTLKSKKSKLAENRNVTKSKESVRKRKDVTKDKKPKKFKNINWQWPHLGPILAMYYSGNSYSGKKRTGAKRELNKGLDISGRIGAPILAAATGEVVYAGSGLLGYGNLVIINHNEVYLSAYAHNKRILVKEGQRIIKGEKIAEMGSSDSKQALLHFEIRRNGQPVDPMKYLPRR